MRKILTLAACALAILATSASAETVSVETEIVPMIACDTSTWEVDGVKYARRQCVDWKTGEEITNSLVNNLDSSLVYAVLEAASPEEDCALVSESRYVCHPALDADWNPIDN